jgi:hypothetical protein
MPVSNVSMAGDFSAISSQLNINRVVTRSKGATQPGLKMNRNRNLSEFGTKSKIDELESWIKNNNDRLIQLHKNVQGVDRRQKFSVSPRPKSNLRSPSSSRRKLRVKFCYNNNPIATYNNKLGFLPLK